MAKRDKNKTTRRGFTMIEVVLFLAITAVMTMAVVQGMIRNIKYERYRDVTKDASEFFRRVYSDVANVENPREKDENMNVYCSIASMWYGDDPAGNNNPTEDVFQNYPGRSDCVIYGKLVTFGEQDNRQTVYEYDVIGTIYNGHAITPDTLDTFANQPISILKNYVQADVLSVRGTGDNCYLGVAGNIESYSPQWEGWFEDQNGNTLKGALLIVRSPIHGTIETYYYDEGTFEVQQALHDKAGITVQCNNATAVRTNFMEYRDTMMNSKLSNFKQGDFYICLDAPDRRGQKRAITIKTNGNNASAVELADDEMSQVHCQGA